MTSNGNGTVDVAAKLLAIVRERTGYPAEMLRLDLDLEADLGIDSIKRVEILGSLKDACRLRHRVELRDDGSALEGPDAGGNRGAGRAVAACRVPGMPGHPESQNGKANGKPAKRQESSTESSVRRMTVRAVELAIPRSDGRAGLVRGGSCWSPTTGAGSRGHSPPTCGPRGTQSW